MNLAHVHLILNHIPLIGMGFVILLLIVAFLLRSNQFINVALVFVILLSLWAIPVYLTGEPAEEMVEDLPGVSHALIEEHEEVAEIAFIFTEITGALALIALIVRRYSDKSGRWITILTIIALIISGGVMTWTANLGGKIRHSEIRSSTGPQNTSPPGMQGDEGDD